MERITHSRPPLFSQTSILALCSTTTFGHEPVVSRGMHSRRSAASHAFRDVSRTYRSEHTVCMCVVVVAVLAVWFGLEVLGNGCGLRMPGRLLCGTEQGSACVGRAEGQGPVLAEKGKEHGGRATAGVVGVSHLRRMDKRPNSVRACCCSHGIVSGA